MPLIRPAAAATLRRFSEVLAAAALAGFGLWLMLLGGWLLWPLGGVTVVLALAWAMQALRRVRFHQPAKAPGVVEIDEAQVGYYAPDLGGYVSLDDLVELRLVRLRGSRFWRLKQSDGQALLVPVDAAGSDRLYDAFAALPGMDTQALVAALEDAAPAGSPLPVTAESIGPVIWRRPAATRRGGGLDLAARSRHL